MDALVRIKKLALEGALEYTRKAREEMAQDALTEEEVRESIVSAKAIAKVLKSRSPWRSSSQERLYVIKSRSFGGTPVYTKGKITRNHGIETFYILISAKISTDKD